MTRSPWRSTAAFAVLCLLTLSGCQSHPGAAAFVGTARIGDNRVQDLIAEGLRDPVVRKGVTDVSAYRGVVLSRLIKHELISQAANRRGVSVSDGEVAKALDTQRSGAGGAQQLATLAAAQPYGIPRGQLEPFIRDVTLLAKIGTDLTKDSAVSDTEVRTFYDENDGAAAGSLEQLTPQIVALIRQQRAAQELSKYIDDFLASVRVKVNPLYGRFDATKFFDNTGAPVLKPAPDDFFDAPTPATSAK